ncbi:hypothetical protein QBC32DRAFT_225348 [Pseudoneurospora amorphoporcata]|uniref:Uncharacterized protein n=1 Tax=Pseudoneurospora amorphoporcata TaxID=241081 RepID=A0AAN6NJA7_9PEZI|nr:hypothetical protein QBC32DRAFT_225348 [Pseudoneurospora amorphoporcata]
MREALLECFCVATRLKTEDVDVAAPSAAIIDIWEGASDGALNFSIESDGKIAFDAPQGFRVRLNIIEIGSGCIDCIHVPEPFHEGSIASMSDLLLLRSVTVVDREGDGDKLGFRWLLEGWFERPEQFPKIDDEELDWLVKAAKVVYGSLGYFTIASMICGNNEAAAIGLVTKEQ